MEMKPSTWKSSSDPAQIQGGNMLLPQAGPSAEGTRGPAPRPGSSLLQEASGRDGRVSCPTQSQAHGLSRFSHLEACSRR